jgi:hypothetical protein
MSYVPFAPRAQRLWPALLIVALPTACAEGVTPDLENAGEPGSTAGATAGGSSGESGSGSGLPQAGTTVTSAGSNASPFGGTSSSAGSAGTSANTGGANTGGANTGGANTGGANTGGASAGGSHTGGSAGASAAGSGGGGSSCACGKTVKWVDNTSISWVKGDCVDVDGKLYLYAGTLPQTYANGPCNPTMQAAWCTDSGNDYKFTLCM